MCPQEAGRLPPAVGPRRPGADERARLEVCLHLHPGVLPQPGGERPGQDQKEIIGTLSVAFNPVPAEHERRLKSRTSLNRTLTFLKGKAATRECKCSIRQMLVC